MKLTETTGSEPANYTTLNTLQYRINKYCRGSPRVCFLSFIDHQNMEVNQVINNKIEELDSLFDEITIKKSVNFVENTSTPKSDNDFSDSTLVNDRTRDEEIEILKHDEKEQYQRESFDRIADYIGIGRANSINLLVLEIW
jgi:hypothetical protein